MPTVSLYVPVAESRPQAGTLVPLPADLKGRRIGLLDNSKGNSDLLLAHVAKALDVRYGLAQVVSHAKPSAAQPAKPAVMEDLATCDLVINGIGDWGSCTSWSVHDTVELEKRGVPVVTVITNAFLQLARAESQAFGLPELPLVVIPHPYGQVPRDRALGVAERAAQEVLAQVEAGQPTASRRPALA